MKKEIRDKIIELKNSGMGYKAIAKELSLTPSAVRCVCNSKYNDPDAFGTCKWCGIRIKMHPGKKKRQFCSDKCRMQWWAAHKENVNRKAYYSFRCPCCGNEFTAYGKSDRVYCSHICYINNRFKKGGNGNGN